ncbi:MAG: hypothetical protein H0U70_09560 [Tatlockia sp.]|nr:hypothetical protein [Tatlockia sp.]
MSIRVLSFDFDGCLFHSEYIKSTNKDVIVHNSDFLAQIAQENLNFSKVYTMVGSTRQSHQIDLTNSKIGNKGSCYPAIKQINEHLKTELDDFLLADIFGGLPEGSSFKKAMDPNYTGSYSDWLYDETKFLILYAQMHKMASKHPEEMISFDFYDDRSLNPNEKPNVLMNLKKYFSQYPELIPSNVSLNLNHYEGKNTTLLEQIKGQGFIDETYGETVKEIARLTQVRGKTDGIHTPLSTTDYVTPNMLNSRNALIIQSSEQKAAFLYLKRNLNELKTGENKLSTQAEIVVDALEVINSSNFTEDEVELLTKAKQNFGVIAANKKVWDSVIPEDIEQKNLREVTAILKQIELNLGHPEHNENIYFRIKSCAWVTYNYTALRKLINKDAFNATAIENFLRKKGEPLAIDGYLSTPFQRLPRLGIHCGDWIKALNSFPDTINGKIVATTIARKFKRVLRYVDAQTAVVDENLKKGDSKSLATLFFEIIGRKVEKPVFESEEVFEQKLREALELTLRQGTQEFPNFIDSEEDFDENEDFENFHQKLKDFQKVLDEAVQPFILQPIENSLENSILFEASDSLSKHVDFKPGLNNLLGISQLGLSTDLAPEEKSVEINQILIDTFKPLIIDEILPEQLVKTSEMLSKSSNLVPSLSVFSANSKEPRKNTHLAKLSLEKDDSDCNCGMNPFWLLEIIGKALLYIFYCCCSSSAVSEEMAEKTYCSF